MEPAPPRPLRLELIQRSLRLLASLLLVLTCLKHHLLDPFQVSSPWQGGVRGNLGPWSLCCHFGGGQTLDRLCWAGPGQQTNSQTNQPTSRPTNQQTKPTSQPNKQTHPEATTNCASFFEPSASVSTSMLLTIVGSTGAVIAVCAVLGIIAVRHIQMLDCMAERCVCVCVCVLLFLLLFLLMLMLLLLLLLLLVFVLAFSQKHL